MLKGAYRITCVFETNARLPEYKGSTLRGVFGHSLKRVVCALKRQTCEGCLLSSTCVYAFLFEALRKKGPTSDNGREPSPPRAYVIEPPMETKTLYHEGDSVDFTMLLFGEANKYLGHIIYAFENIGRDGIGAHVDGKPGRFRLDRVTSGNKVVYSSSTGLIDVAGNTVEDISPEMFLNGAPDAGPKRDITIEMVTPLRVKFHNRLEPELPFHILVRASLRRISSLYDNFGEGQPGLDYRGLVHRAMSVRIKESTLMWVDWKRYSSRQDQKMLMGGMMGSVAYADVPSEYMPLLTFCEEVHIGKQTTFGLGKFALREHGQRQPDTAREA